MQSQIEEELALKKQQEIQKQQERQQRIEEISRTVPVVNTRNVKKKNYPKENIAFKCNYCDGGKDQNGIGKPGGTDGFTTLWEHGRLDLSVEAYVLKPEYAELFTEDEKNMCRDRLLQFGYEIN